MAVRAGLVAFCPDRPFFCYNTLHIMAYQRYDTPYKPGQKTPFKISRSKIDLFVECPRCFWLDRVQNIKRPNTPPFLINAAVDTLLKREFDVYRSKAQPHPWFAQFHVDAIPFSHADLDTWRENFVGVQFLHEPTNLLVFGAVDDVWVNTAKELHVVDYKATAKTKEITDLDPPGGWHDAYRRQMEVYQWLLRANGFSVSDVGYFVYANGIATADSFDNAVTFRTHIFPYTGNANWIDGILVKIKDVLESRDIPQQNLTCDYCAYTGQRLQLAWNFLKKSRK